MKIQTATFAIVDCETTGLDPKSDKIVEIASVVIQLGEHAPHAMFSILVNPEMSVPPEVSAVHGLTDADVANAPTFVEALGSFDFFLGRFGGAEKCFLTAHNAPFDAAFLGLDGCEWIDTKRLAMRLWPTYPQHRNQTLRFRRQLKVETYGIAPHRALGDALVTAALLSDELTCDEFQALGIDSVDGLLEYLRAPMLLPTLPFGKHRGEPIASVPQSYCAWMLREKKDIDPDLRFTLEHRLKSAA